MSTATQTFPAITGSNWGSINRQDDGSPSYSRPIASEESNVSGYRDTSGAGTLVRGFLELDMAVLVAGGYVAGTTVASAELAFTGAGSGTASARLVVDPAAALGDSDAALFAQIGPAETAWSANKAFSGAGPDTIAFNATALTAIAALGATDKRIIGFCLVDEATNGNFAAIDVFADATITLTFTLGAAAPTTQATNVNVTTLSADNIGFGWTSGNGAKRAVFVKAASSGTAAPVDDATYTANTTLGAGTQIGSSGWYCVYNGIGNEASVSGLTPEVTYRIHVCEYNGDPAAEKYNDDAAANNPINQQAVTIPPIAQATTVSATAVTAVSATVSWARGGGDKVVVFGKAASSGNLSGAVTDYQTYTANTALGSGTQIGSTGWFAVYNGTGTSTSVTNLLSGTNYVFAAIEYNGTAGDENYLDDTDTGNPGGFTTLSPSVMMSRSHRRSRTQRRRIGGK